MTRAQYRALQWAVECATLMRGILPFSNDTLHAYNKKLKAADNALTALRPKAKR